MEKARFDKMLQNEEIKLIVTALGTGIGTEEYDVSKLRYHKVIIMTDADVDGSHIRTLLLTFFFRQMRELIERGHLYIAQPPLFKVVDKKTELYIHNEEQMRNYILENGVNKVSLMMDDGSRFPASGNKLLNLIKKMMRIEDLLDRFEKERRDRNVLRVLAGDPALKESSFKNEKNLQAVAKRTIKALKESVTDFKLEQDLDHGGFKIVFDLKKNGHTVTTCMDSETFRSPQFTEIRALLEQVSILGEPPYRDVSEDVKNPVILESSKSLIDHILSVGKKGITVQRYKGLGEMNPEQLWGTTMNPEKRSLLQVTVDDAVLADEIFTTLMGDEVEPRRDFIYKNALDVSNLDI